MLYVAMVELIVIYCFIVASVYRRYFALKLVGVTQVDTLIDILG